MSNAYPENPSTDLVAESGSSNRKRRWPYILLWLVCGLLMLVMLSGAAGVLWLRSTAKTALPVLDGDVPLSVVNGEKKVAALSAPVVVRRDAHGVPHIDAASQEDLFLAQGYVTAQDRLWQMDAFRRNSNGELAEIMGSSLLRHDKAQRMFQFRNVARRIYANMPADERARYEAYARGVNLYIVQHQNSLPPEFHLLHYKPQPWSGVDSISIGMMMVDMLDTHWYVKLSRERIAARLHNPKLESDLYPVGSWRDHPPTGLLIDLSKPHPEPTPPPGEDEEDDRSQTSVIPDEGLRTLRDLLGPRSCEGCAPGSNNWVIAGAHTASGKPLLSNDMHLGLTEPNIWYMADLRAPGFHAAGVTLPGVPFVIAGHNEHVAWGFTALYGDVQDLYVERIDGKGNYFEPGNPVVADSWKPLIIDHEVIHVRGRKDVEFDVQSTAHGPLLDPMFTKDKRALALHWTLYDTTLNSIPIYQMNAASNWAEFSAALAQWCFPTQNVVYSDDQGHIAYHAVGRIPQRPAGLVSVPIQDVAGTETKHEWQGFIPFDSLPNALDPPSGFLATANSRVTTDGTPSLVSLDWADPYRAERIYKTLQGRDQLSAQDMLAVQTDIYSEVDQELAHRFAYAIDHATGTDDRLRAAADLMRSWDGRLTVDSAAASLVTQSRKALWPMILEPKLGSDAEFYSWSESNFAEEELIMHASPDWLPSGFKDWDALLTEAVRRGMKAGNAPSKVTAWAYGSWHVVDIEHPLSGFLPFFGRIVGTGPQPLSGDTTTVKQVGRDFGPSQRFTMDWSNIDGSTENIALGESGNPYSSYFRDQWKDYYAGATFALPFSPAAVAAQSRHTMRLLP
jgi:penicillin amidase